MCDLTTLLPCNYVLLDHIIILLCFILPLMDLTLPQMLYDSMEPYCMYDVDVIVNVMNDEIVL